MCFTKHEDGYLHAVINGKNIFCIYCASSDTRLHAASTTLDRPCVKQHIELINKNLKKVMLQYI